MTTSDSERQFVGDWKSLAERIAEYVETALSYGEWSKREAMVEAVRIACEDAARETLDVIRKVRGWPISGPCPTCDGQGCEEGCGSCEMSPSAVGPEAHRQCRACHGSGQYNCFSTESEPTTPREVKR